MEEKNTKKYEIGVDAISQRGYFLASVVGQFENEKGEKINFANLQILQISKKDLKPKIVKLKYFNGKEPELIKEIKPLDKIEIIVDYATLCDLPVVLDVTKILKRSDLEEFKS